MLVKIGAVQAIAAPAPIRLSNLRREMPCSWASGCAGLTASPAGFGVQGLNSATSGTTAGVNGQSSSPTGIGVLGSNGATAGQAVGVQGGTSSASGIAIFGKTTAPNGFGAGGLNLGTTGQSIGCEGQTFAPDGFGVSGVNSATTGKSCGVYGQTGSPGGFGMLCKGDFAASGSKFAVVPFRDGTMRGLYAMESPECWFEDFGSAQLVGGVAHVALDRGFAAVVRNKDYHVFVMPEGDCRGLYVAAKDAHRFTVRELQGGKASVRFSYRVVARRKDVKGSRFPEIDLGGLFSNQLADTVT